MLNPGTQLGPYEIIATLGAGGMGEVYVARDPRLDRQVAIKVLPEHLGNNESALVRFEREAKAVAALSHPNILSIHDFGHDQGISYAVTELLEGETLKSRINRSDLNANTVLKVASDVANGLAAAHSRGIIHRDLKPENIFLTSDDRIKLLDFGLARYTPIIPQQELTSVPTQSSLTEAGVVMGTMPYMSPEQLRGQPVDERTDIFSFGCVLYEMMTRTRAFSGHTSADVITAILTHDPEHAKSERNFPPELDAMVRRCLKKNPEQRYSSSQELVSELQRIREEQSQSVSLRRQIARQIRRPLVGIPAILLIASAVFAVIWFSKRQMEVNRARNETIPEIIKLIEAEKYDAAFKLARKAEQLIPDDPGLKKLWPEFSRVVAIHTVPEGAAIYRKEYDSPDSDWEFVGQSPLTEIRIPIGLFRWKLEKSGFQTIQRSDRFPQFQNPKETVTLNFTLDKSGALPPGMVRVTGENFALANARAGSSTSRSFG